MLEKDTVQYPEDGVNFQIMASLEDIPPAGGAYIPDKFDDPKNGQGFPWGCAITARATGTSYCDSNVTCTATATSSCSGNTSVTTAQSAT